MHIVFSTKHRQNLIDKHIEVQLFEYIGGICQGLHCHPLRVGGFQNHIHILCILSKNICQADLLEEIKKRSSKWIKTQGAQYANFYWQNGYGIFSVNPRQIERVISYINNQKEHHIKKSFQQEYVSILNTNNVDFDERYVWD